MNINREIANRALEKAGEEPLNDNDFENNSVRWRTIKNNYLPTLLETLANTAWTSQKKRAKLELITKEEAENFTEYLFAYRLPADCAKPEALTDENEYIVEGTTLYTNSENAVLLYIQNGYRGKPIMIEADPQPTAETFQDKDYFVFDSETEEYTKAETFDSEATYFVEKEEDYPLYEELQLDPLLSEYLETRLAAKIALKITGKSDLYQLLYSESQLMENRAIKVTVSHSRNKDMGHRYWGEILGMSKDGL